MPDVSAQPMVPRPVIVRRTVFAPATMEAALTTRYTVGTTDTTVKRLTNVILYYVNHAKTGSATAGCKKGGKWVQNAKTARTDGSLEAVDLGTCESGIVIATQFSDGTSFDAWIDADVTT